MFSQTQAIDAEGTKSVPGKISSMKPRPDMRTLPNMKYRNQACRGAQPTSPNSPIPGSKKDENPMASTRTHANSFSMELDRTKTRTW